METPPPLAVLPTTSCLPPIQVTPKSPHTHLPQVTPENPLSVQQLGFDSVWVHSGYFDIIQQHRGEHGWGWVWREVSFSFSTV